MKKGVSDFSHKNGGVGKIVAFFFKGRGVSFIVILTVPASPPPFVKKGNQDFQLDMLIGGIFSEIMVGETKRGEMQYFAVVQQGGDLSMLVIM